MSYEDGIGKKNVVYSPNETKITIVKEDETKQRLEGTIFDLLDKDKNIVLSNLTTDKEGEIKIDSILPGYYFLRETKASEGYQIMEKEIEIKVKFNEELTVVVSNKKEEIPEVIVSRNQLSLYENATKIKLPKTGM